jgi:DUF971 family protein
VSILDDLQPAARRPRPTAIAVEGADLRIDWDDGATHRPPLLMLRARCPCAGCVDEWTGKRLLNVTTLRPDVRPASMTEVGRYAVQVGWSDGHQTGIYSWDLLRRLCEEHAGKGA